MPDGASHLGPVRLLWRLRKVLRRRNPGEILRTLAAGATGAVSIRFPRLVPLVLVVDPDLVGQLLVDHAAEVSKGPGIPLLRPMLGNGLLTSEGESHHRARRVVGAALSPRRLAGYVDGFGSTAQSHFRDRWHDGEALDMHEQFGRLTLDIVGRTLLGVDLTEHAPDLRAALEVALRQFGATTGGGRLFVRRPPGVLAPLADVGPAGRAAQQAAHQAVDEVIALRRASPDDDRGDLLSALLRSAAENAMSPAEVHDHTMTMVMAGHETTANALTWTAHLLADRPDVQRRLQHEVDELPGLPRFDDLAALPYTRAVISEALRLYPPAWSIGRSVLEPLRLGNRDLEVGTFVLASPLLLHHDARSFPEPELFDPDRWLDERRLAVPRYAFLPFGTGPRACIGEQFAWAEMICVLAVLARSWTVSRDPGGEGMPEPQHFVTLRPAGGGRLTVRARRQSHRIA
jgi:cytochrome P450